MLPKESKGQQLTCQMLRKSPGTSATRMHLSDTQRPCSRAVFGGSCSAAGHAVPTPGAREMFDCRWIGTARKKTVFKPLSLAGQCIAHGNPRAPVSPLAGRGPVADWCPVVTKACNKACLSSRWQDTSPRHSRCSRMLDLATPKIQCE